MNKERGLLRRVAHITYRNITLLLFLILPVKVTKVFLELSVALLITEVRGFCSVESCFDVNKFNKLLNMNYDKEILELPSYTLNWFWTPVLLNQTIKLQEGEYSLRAALMDDKLLRHNLSTVTAAIMDCLPVLMKFKLHLNDKRSKIKVRHEVMSLINQGLVAA